MAEKEGLMQVAVDAVVFTCQENMVKVLLIRRKKEPFEGKYALPGGFVEAAESAEEAVLRELQEETGVENIFLKQLKAYTAPKRDPRGRVVSVAFMALISPEQNLSAASDALSAEWVSINRLPQLAFDHKQILEDALVDLRLEIQTTNIAAQILPKRFTLSELQKLYEVILEKSLDKRNFRKRISQLEILKEVAETKMEGAHRPAQLYQFTTKEYTTLREKVHVFLE
ncbi:NUDIX hydrolase [Candidatus Woesearchaeota archaeon]|nr:NUDIX hydrolase [Candidatus Woesearchaeota archaeon]